MTNHKDHMTTEITTTARRARDYLSGTKVRVTEGAWIDETAVVLRRFPAGPSVWVDVVMDIDRTRVSFPIDILEVLPASQSAVGSEVAATIDAQHVVTAVMRVPDPESKVTITGDRRAVLREVALTAGMEHEDDVAVRPSTNDDGSMLIVDARQSEGYTAYLAELVSGSPVVTLPDGTPAMSMELPGQRQDI